MQGKTINGFELKRQLGVGGMAEVWYAENRIGKKAAVKILLPKLCQDENVTSRFYTEAKVMVDLNHPNIRQVYDYGELDGRPAIIMEYLEGDDLKARMKRGQRFTNEELKKWWNQLVSALNYTHQKGIVHRDIKPGNIFVDTEGNIKLLDFGIAKVRESISSTQTGQKLGTLMYMSPEQVKDSKHIDYRTDIYSLAVTYIHLLTGKKPYDSDTSSDFEISESIVYKPLDLSGLPVEWRDFLTPYLNKVPEQRPALCEFKNASPHAVNVGSDEEGTIVCDAPTKPMQKKEESQRPSQSERKPVASDAAQGKSKKGLWIGLGVAAVAAAVLLLLLIKPKEELVVVDPDTEAYQACQTVDEYRAYLRDFGRNALYYVDAKAFVDQYIADSTAEAQRLLAKQQAEAEAQAEDEAQAKAETAEKKEEEAYKKCTTLSACYRYNKSYPNGKFHNEVQLRMFELEPIEWAMRKNSVTITFSPGSDLLPTLRAVIYLKKIVDVAKANNFMLNIKGTGDGKASQKNQTLAENRCLRIRMKLMELGVEEKNMIMEPTDSGIGYGRVRVQLVEEGGDGEISELQTIYGDPSPLKTLVSVYYFPNGSVDMANTANRLANEAVCDFMGSGKKIHGFEIRGYVSPEMEDQISNLYANAVVEDIKTELRSAKVDVDNLKFKAIGCGMWDWEPMLIRLECSDVDDYFTIHGKLKESKNKRQTCKELFKTYPQLSREIAPTLRFVQVFAY